MKFVLNSPAVTCLTRRLAPMEKYKKMQRNSLQNSYTFLERLLNYCYCYKFPIDLRPPKAKVTRSNRVGCANCQQNH